MGKASSVASRQTAGFESEWLMTSGGGGVVTELVETAEGGGSFAGETDMVCVVTRTSSEDEERL